ncbi:MAG: hypothetical protein F6K58_31165 [Symploca sp. SIO2E9]|nr:hypothetical protein [Symploca sp. SIO2E9]
MLLERCGRYSVYFVFRVAIIEIIYYSSLGIIDMTIAVDQVPPLENGDRYASSR